MDNIFCYGKHVLTVGKTIALAKAELQGVLDEEVIQKIRSSEQYVREIINNNKTVYGINTGFGILANTKISEEDTATLQHKFYRAIVLE